MTNERLRSLAGDKIAFMRITSAYVLTFAFRSLQLELYLGSSNYKVFSGSTVTFSRRLLVDDLIALSVKYS
jgi:hypothetical protein